MGHLLNLLLRSTGESPTRSSLGDWRRAISTAVESVVAAVDALVAAGSAALGVAQYLQATTSVNANVQLNTDLVLNTVVAQRGVAYDTTTGIATLTAGRTYSLRAAGSLTNFAGGASASLDVTWVDAVTNNPLVDSAVGNWTPVNENTNAAPSNAVEVVYTPSTNQTVKLRCIASGGGSAQAVSDHFWAVIQQIG